METLLPPATLAAIIGLTQVLKMSGIPKTWIPITTLALGVCAIYLTEGVTGTTTILGIMVGLMSMGLWSGTKTTIGK